MTQQDPLAGDFRKFLYVIWKHLRLPAPTKRQYAMAHFLQGPGDRKILEAWRGAAKSWITAAFVLWLLYQDQTLNVVVVSASKQRADAFTTFVMRLVDEVPELQFLRPRADQRNSRQAFDVGPAPPSQTPSVISVGITSTFTGHRASVIVADDVESPNNSDTETLRDKLRERISEFESLLKPGGKIVFLGTPQCDDSIYNELIDKTHDDTGKKLFVTRLVPVRYPTEARIARLRDYLDPEIVREVEKNPSLAGRTVEPTRFSDADLATRELIMGKAEFARQFDLDTEYSTKDVYPLKLKDLIFYPVADEYAPERLAWASIDSCQLGLEYCTGHRGDRMYRGSPFDEKRFAPYTGRIMAFDPAGGGRDEIAWAVTGHVNSQVVLLDVEGTLDGPSEETFTRAAESAKRFKVNLILYEKNYGGEMTGTLLQSALRRINYPCKVEAITSSGQKEKRALQALGPTIRQHRLIVNEALVQKDYESSLKYGTELAQQYRFFYQLTRLREERGCLAHDDRLDAVAMAVGYWAEFLTRTVDQAAAQTTAKQDKQRAKKALEARQRSLSKTGWAPPPRKTVIVR